MTLLRIFFAWILPTAGIALLQAQENLSEEQLTFFENEIRPALVKYCYECHSEESGKTRGGLLLDTREGMLNGGGSGPLMEAPSGYNSLFVDAITWDDPDYEMPPKEQMPPEVIAHFMKWLEMGAPDPRLREKIVVESTVDIEEGKMHWAFQPRARPVMDSVDAFIDAKLQEAELEPVGAADATTLLRRLNFDLTGLPPAADEVRAFVGAWRQDPAAATVARIDELLERPQYGERWGRHWLDVARYAESSGNTNFTFPHAWRYRDYVIDSFNEDKPYDRFIVEQVAGDLLPVEDDAEFQENLIATGFLAVGIKSLGDRNPRTFRMDMIDEQIDTTSRAFLGLTVACARCHDHKFDPIPTTDYYAMAGIFMSTNTLYGTVSGLQNHRFTDLLELPLADANQFGSLTPEEVETLREELNQAHEERRAMRAAADGGKEVEQRKFVGIRNRIGQIQGKLGTVAADGRAITFGMGVQDAEPVSAPVLLRGDVERPGQEVARGFLHVLPGGGAAQIPEGTSGRLELARWIASPDSPLTARVMVNRIWMHLMGRPLMGSPNNWGPTGQTPTHPELLDYLANRFVESGWSVKELIREIVQSKTYQRGSTFHESNYAADPENELLWRASPRQLDAEALRDSMLAASGSLDLSRPYGSKVAETGDARIGRQVDERDFADVTPYRSVYLPVIRDHLVEPLALFNFANPIATSGMRETTNVPPQALYLMNSAFVTREARAMALRLWEQYDNPDHRVKGAFLQAYGRLATEDDVAAGRRFFQSFVAPDASPVVHQAAPERPGRRGADRGKGRGRERSRERDDPPAPQPTLSGEQMALSMFCQALMGSAEFRILN